MRGIAQQQDRLGASAKIGGTSCMRAQWICAG